MQQVHDNEIIEIVRVKLDKFCDDDAIVYIVKGDSKTVGRTLMRAQEFYENPAHHDVLLERRAIDAFYNDSYVDYCAGYNIPGKIVQEVAALISSKCLVDDETYDSFFVKLHDAITTDASSQCCERFYVIGIPIPLNMQRKKYEKEIVHVLRHELAHALFSLSTMYRSDMQAHIDKLRLRTHAYDALRRVLGQSYAEHVIDDELQAYMSTGFDREFAFELKNMGISFNELRQIKIPFAMTYEEYYEALDDITRVMSPTHPYPVMTLGG